MDCGDKKDFTAILETIDADMHLGLEKVAKKPLATGMEQIKNGNYLEKAQSRRDVDDATFWEGSVRQEKACSYTRKEYAEEEKAYWGKYGIYEDTLNRYSVISLMEYKEKILKRNRLSYARQRQNRCMLIWEKNV